MKKTSTIISTKDKLIIIFIAIFVVAGTVGFLQYQQYKNRKQLAIYTYRYTHTSDEAAKSILKSNIENLLSNTSLSKEADAKKGSLIDRLIECSIWADHMMSLPQTYYNQAFIGSMDHDDLLFDCFFSGMDVTN